MARYELEQNKPRHQVVQYPYTIAKQKDHIIAKLHVKERVPFAQLIEENPNKIAVIFNFLAVLELLQTGHITIKVGEGFNNFWLVRLEEELVD